ncbi:hypothetical protein HG537_0C04800 [Torulaspora globosa]|uniref:DUF1279 domain-containing protein n=1 Tax=Torulaspora globosa TaxID=48254 RepID=A0A7H9HRC9_9SACH|nr:hypothetical protein HG537_0C04800 [Torulaspora sp. CBS 2947]
MFRSRLCGVRWMPIGLSRSVLRTQLRTVPLRRLNSTQTITKPKGIKGLMQLYGYSALGVYLALTALDLPLCFLMVHSLGEERIKVYLNKVKNAFGFGIAEEDVTKQVREQLALKEERERTGKNYELSWWERFKQSTLLAEFLIAYGIHKSLIVVRLPLTAAITPATVRILQKWGFNIGNPKMLKTLAQDAKIRYKSGKPNDFIKTNNADPAFAKQKPTKGQKWFNGLM